MWTMDNTEGFTQDQLDTINAAIDLIDGDFDESGINDAINNAWIEQATPEELAEAALEILGKL